MVFKIRSGAVLCKRDEHCREDLEFNPRAVDF